MRKKLTAILIALTIAISLLPMPAMAATASETREAAIKAAVTKVVKDYAKQVYRPNADDDAFSKFFKHGFYGNHKDMPLTENGPMVSALFNSGVMQETLIHGITNTIVIMQDLNLDAALSRGGPSWHDYGYSFSYSAYAGTEKDITQYLGSVVSTMTAIYGPGGYGGPRNENDTVMELLVGSMYAYLTVTQVQQKEQTAVYNIHLDIHDDFDFTSDYSKLAEKGYNTSNDQDLVNIGYLLTFLGLDEFYWYFEKNFQVEVPIHCDHGAYNYHFTYDGSTVTVSSEDGNGYTHNPTSKITYTSKSTETGEISTKYYHKLNEGAFLKHDRPWVMEWDQVGMRNHQFSSGETSNCYLYPTVHSYAQQYVWFHLYEVIFLDGASSTYVSHYIGVDLKEKFQYSYKHTYTHTLENVVNADGSNTVYLTVYDHDLGEIVIGPEPMDDHWTKGEKDEERTLIETDSTLMSGRDLYINYLGNRAYGLSFNDTVLDMRIWENGKDAEPDTGSYTAPTCTDKGGYLHHCPKCGDDYLTQEEAALGHTFGEYAEDDNTTCTADGTKTRVCARCGEKDTVTMEGSAYGHSYGDYTNDGNTTCTVDGTETRICAACGNTETRTMAGSAQGHKFGAHQFDHNSSCTADGTMTAVCSVCGEKDIITAEGSATGHNHKAVVTAPTCTEQGYTTYTCHCGDSYVDDYTAPTPHKEVILPAIPSTCVEKGKTEGKQCELCGLITVPQTPTAYGNHTWDEGTVIKQPTLTEPGTLMYTCIHCSKTSHMSITELPKNDFDDVPADAYYAAAVAWAKENGITSGLSETLFGSDVSCTRGQVVTFLWAAAGRPEPKTTNNPFTDVSENDYFYKPVLWAVENAITGGIGDGLFGPHETCTRGQIVTFLWASQGKPASGSSTFTDVADTDWYAKSVVWAAENGVTGGIGNNMFGPNNTCTRAQVVTFLYKVYG